MIGKRERIAAMEILCTNGVKSVMVDLVPAFERTSGTRVMITWGATNSLLKDLEGGAGGDLAILTAEAIDDLISGGKVVAGGRVDLARSGIGVAVLQAFGGVDLSVDGRRVDPGATLTYKGVMMSGVP